MNRLKNIGLKGFKFRFEFQVGQVFDLPSDAGLVFLTITRGPKVAISKRVMPVSNKCGWNESLTIVSTLYKDTRQMKFTSKEARISLKKASGKSGYKKIATAAIDLADYCNNEGSAQDVNVLLEGKSKSKNSHMMRMVIKASFIANSDDGSDSASEMSDMTHITMGSDSESTERQAQSDNEGGYEKETTGKAVVVLPTIEFSSTPENDRRLATGTSPTKEMKSSTRRETMKDAEYPKPSAASADDQDLLSPGPVREYRRPSFSITPFGGGRGLLSDYSSNQNPKREENSVQEVKKAYELEIKGLKEQIAQLKKENQHVYQKIAKGSGDAVSSNIGDIMRENMQLRDQLDSLRAHTAELSGQISKLEEEKETLTKGLQQPHITTPSTPSSPLSNTRSNAASTPSTQPEPPSPSGDSVSVGRKLVYGHSRKPSRNGATSARSGGDASLDAHLSDGGSENAVELEKVKQQLADTKKSLDGSRLRCRELERELKDAKTERDDLLQTLIKTKVSLAQSEEENGIRQKTINDMKKAQKQMQRNSIRIAQHLTSLEVQYADSANPRKASVPN